MDLIQFYKPTLNRKDMDAVLQTMVDEKIGPGEKKKEFENLFLTLTEKDNCISLRTYLDALEIALKIAGCKKGSRVGVSVISPSIYSLVAERLSVELVLIDIDSENCCLDYEKAIAKDCEILLVHEAFGSLPINDGFLENSPVIIEDISQSLGSNYNNFSAGHISDIVVSSFEENNMVSTAGGAIVAVNGKEKSDLLAEFNLNYREMTDLNASLGIIQLKKFNERQSRRKEIFKVYQNSLLKTKHKLFGLMNIDFENTGSGFCVLLNSKPEDVIKFALKYQVPCRRSFASCVGKDRFQDFDSFPIGSVYIMRAVDFPLYPYLTRDEIEAISRVIAHMP